MKVYGVHFGNDNEGCFCPCGLFKKLKDAEYCLISQVTDANDLGHYYEIAGENYYRDGYDYLKIIKHEIL